MAWNDRFTTKAQEALGKAQELMLQHNHNQLEHRTHTVGASSAE